MTDASTAAAGRRSIRPAVASDLDRLGALALRSKGHWGYSADFLDACREELTPRSDQLGDVFLAEAGVGEDVTAVYGFVTLTALGEDRAEVEHLFVDPPFIGGGHGRALLDHARDIAVHRGFRVLEIQSDPEAQGFYERQGARKIGEKPSGSVTGRLLPLLEIDLASQG